MPRVFLPISFIPQEIFLKLFLSTNNLSGFLTAGGSWCGEARHRSESGGQKKDFLLFPLPDLSLEGRGESN